MSALLNPAQREAIRYLDGPCLVIAGAGSGKTRVITHKIAHLIEAGIRPQAIGAITFTNKAAQEMGERLASMVKLPADARPMVSTFHALGVQILRRDGRAAGLKSSFSILDADDCLAILQEALATTDRKLLRAAQGRISLWKNALVGPDEAARTAADATEHACARAYREYAATLSAYQAVDFDDLIVRPVRLFESSPEVLQAWRERLRYLLVDEYQDTNACQYALLKLLVGPRAAFTAVGDDDQSIYGWRGATLENLRRLGDDFPALRVIKLEQNYRSSQRILAAANQLIAHNPKLHDKRLWSELGTGDPLAVVACDDDEHEAESVVMRLQAHKFERRAQFRDYAILYRGNHQARVFEQRLRAEKVPYVLSGGQSFFERAEIRDLMAYLRLLANDDDDPAFIRAATTPKRGIGTATLEALGRYAGERHTSMYTALFETGFETRVQPRQLAPLRQFGEFMNRTAWRAQREPAGPLLDELLGAIGYRAHLYDGSEDKVAATRWQNVCDFVDWLKRRADDDGDDPGAAREATAAVAADGARAGARGEGATLAAIAQRVALLSQLDRKESDPDAVRLTTIHAAKGLEFPHVFVVGCEEGLLPHHGGEQEDANEVDANAREREASRIEEERRLMYVAVTRAQRSLSLTWCKQRKRARDAVPREPSRFLKEMQLDAAPAPTRNVTAEDAKAKLANLRALLARPKG